jgi:subtilisin family serine protease
MLKLLHSHTLLTALVALALLGGGRVAQPISAGSVAYVEPELAQSDAAQISVIVTAASSEIAAQAVQLAQGQVTSDLWLIDSVAAEIPAQSVAALSQMPGVQSVVANHDVRSTAADGWVTDFPLPDHWDGRPDIQATADRRVWNLVNPVTIDIGADVVQRTLLPSGDPIKGSGVTVALVDSGVYFDDNVRQQLDPVIQRLFVGQADFVDPICRTETVGRRTRRVGTQLDDACFLAHRDTTDTYGHGTAIASIIWNNFTDSNTGVTIGVAPEAQILSVRVLDESGSGSYETVIRGIQFVVENKARFDVRVLNLSLSAPVSTPYFIDPLNRAVERAWGRGIVVVTAAGNDGPAAESITVPGNDPYVITVGSVDENRTPGYWSDDFLPTWSGVGPTLDGFAKPDLLAPGVNIVTFMHRDPSDPSKSQKIVQVHPDNAAGISLFRMSGTSMSAAITSGVVALMLQANPGLTPDNVKYRLGVSARPAVAGESTLVYNVLQQGMGRIWAPDAVLGAFDRDGNGNPGMHIRLDTNAGDRGRSGDRSYRFHYQGPIQRVASTDGQAYLYYVMGDRGSVLGLAGVWKDGMSFIDMETLASGRMAWATGRMAWATSMSNAAGRMAWATGRMAWATGRMAWATSMSSAAGRMAWATGRMAWATGRTTWDGGAAWSADQGASAAGRMAWATDLNPEIMGVSTTTWVDE